MLLIRGMVLRTLALFSRENTVYILNQCTVNHIHVGITSPFLHTHTHAGDIFGGWLHGINSVLPEYTQEIEKLLLFSSSPVNRPEVVLPGAMILSHLLPHHISSPQPILLMIAMLLGVHVTEVCVCVCARMHACVCVVQSVYVVYVHVHTCIMCTCMSVSACVVCCTKCKRQGKKPDVYSVVTMGLDS